MSRSDTTEDLRELCPRFRVLVLGRRNAGKTTILKKMTGSEDGAFEVRNKYGDLVKGSSILEPNVERGISDIEHEITFKSNPRFVFHDSRGIEAGAESDVNSKLRIEHIRAFIARRASEMRLRDQLHAIWFCIPVDKPRIPSAEFELRFFDRGTLSVPVIAVFTKFEALVDKAYEELLDEDRSESEADDQADERAQANFNCSIWKAIKETKHPPKGHVQLQRW